MDQPSNFKAPIPFSGSKSDDQSSEGSSFNETSVDPGATEVTLFNNPRKVVAGCDGDFWVVDSGNHRLCHFKNSSRKALEIISSVLPQRFIDNLNYPTSMTISHSCSVIWTVDSSQRIIKYIQPFTDGATEIYGNLPNQSLPLFPRLDNQLLDIAIVADLSSNIMADPGKIFYFKFINFSILFDISEF